MDTNFSHILAELFLYAYEADFLQKLLSNTQKTLAATFISDLGIYMYNNNQ